MRLYTYQHPIALQTLQKGNRFNCLWEHVPGQRWQTAFRWMCQKMAGQAMPIGENAPIWAWHSVYRLGGKPDYDWANGLLFGYQLEQGIDLLELNVPDAMALLSNYDLWNEVLDCIIDGNAPPAQATLDCFAVQLARRRGRPPAFFPGIQACLPYIEPAWLVGQEPLDAPKMLQQRETLISRFVPK